MLTVSGITETQLPKPAAKYEKKYQQFRKIYPAVKELYAEKIEESEK